MNDIINWVALNNTLMIRIGFSAVVLLLVVYAFRFFFMPSASVVASESSSKVDSSKESADMHIEELAELQGEIDTLKAKLKELQSADAKPAVAAAAPAPAAAGVEMVREEPAPSMNETAANELKDKIKSLEARLSEYEIISEEIAEIGKLRLENQKLKEMLVKPPAAPEAPAVAETAAAEAAPPETAVSDSEIDALLGSVDENTAADAENPLAAEDAAAEAALGGVSVEAEEALNVSGAEAVPEKELFIIHSEVEVTEEEKELINSFEQFKKV